MSQITTEEQQKKLTAERDNAINGIKIAQSSSYRKNQLQELESVALNYMQFFAAQDNSVEWVQPVRATLINLLSSKDKDVAKLAADNLLAVTKHSNMLYNLSQETVDSPVVPYLAPVRDAFIAMALEAEDSDIQDHAITALNGLVLNSHVLGWMPSNERLPYIAPVLEAYIKIAGDMIPQLDDMNKPVRLIYDAMADSDIHGMLWLDHTTYVSQGMDLVTQAYEAAEGGEKQVWGTIKAVLADSHMITPFLSKDSLKRAGYLNVEGKSGQELNNQTGIWLDYLGNHPDMVQEARQQLSERDAQIIVEYNDVVSGVLTINDDEKHQKLKNLMSDHQLLAATLQHERLMGVQPV